MLNKPVLSLLLMILVWLMTNVIWVGLVLLLTSALTGRIFLAGPGWLFLGVYWLSLSGHYLEIKDYFNVALVITAALFSFYLGSLILSRGRNLSAFAWISYAASITGFVYFPFAELSPLKIWLIGKTALLTAGLLKSLGVPVVIASWNIIALNDHSVEIILACTSIESIALFTGLILSVKAQLLRKLLAITISVPVVYFLNLIRNAFVLVAYGKEWFGDGSFYVAHNVISKFGSMLVLFLIAYLVFLVLPELLDLIDELAMEIRRPGGDAA